MNREGATYARGIALTTLGAMVVTPDSLLVRLTHLDALGLAAGRGIISGAVILLGCAFYFGRDFPKVLRALGWAGLATAILYAIGNIAFYTALTHTLVANVLIAFATIPLLGALMSRFVLGHHVPRITWFAIATACCGLGFVVYGDLAAGMWLGNAAALVAALTLAGMFTIVSEHPEISMIPAAGIGIGLSGGAGLVGLWLTGGIASGLAGGHWGWLLLGGCVVIPLAMSLITYGARLLPPAETGLLMLLETVLGPLWVWLVLGEHPGIMTLSGGTLVVLTLLVHGVVRRRQRPPAMAPAH